MNCKVEKTKNANEVKLELTIEAKKFESVIKFCPNCLLNLKFFSFKTSFTDFILY